MILGTLLYPSRYNALGRRVRMALDYLAEQENLPSLPLGRITLEDDSLYVDVFEAETVPHESKLFEAHRRYVDIHVTLEGQEWYGYAPTNNIKLSEAYDPKKDIEFYSGEGVYFQVPKGQFALFFPEDAHKPLIAFGGLSKVKKLVVKALL